ncbi:hypothetical protein H4Q26_000331, partial [Puccinia striiformis f. sp. tritici PST-130]
QNLRDSKLLDHSSNPALDIHHVCAEIITPEYCASLYRHCGYAMPCGLESKI